MRNRGKKRWMFLFTSICWFCVATRNIHAFLFQGTCCFYKLGRTWDTCVSLGHVAWELFHGAVLWGFRRGWSCRSRGRGDVSLQSQAVSLAYLKGLHLNPIVSCCFPPVSIGCHSLCTMNFSPLVTNPSHALCGQPRQTALSSESCRAIFYSPSLWSPAITWKSVLSFLCAEPAYFMLAVEKILKCTV